MSFLYPSARAWAEDHSLSSEVRLAQLEVMAYQRHPEIFEHFGADGAAVARRSRTTGKRSSMRGIAFAAVILVWIAAAVVPIAGLAVLMGDRFEFFRIEAERSIPIAAVLFTVAAVAQAVFLVVWLLRGARFSWPEFSVPLIAAAMAVLTLGTTPGVAELDGYADWQGGRTPVFVSLGVSTLAAIAMLVRFRVREPDGDGEAAAASGLGAGDIRARIASLPWDERQAMVDDRNAALAVLHERGLIDADTLELALSRDPGTLHLIDAERRR
ncbi:hypothetical protein [Microbacterium sp. cf332]|uniref:hypothetical protein n=1 Tax=Microbacterium sp. cf332 TaxID=1761804 RepID=UPI0008865582|nr:hypothetical protein [Microbacterium sp. cf332]SDQ76631.1 hypothetical protein SAMN04487847_2414 [Microbacterium sp. cf332]